MCQLIELSDSNIANVSGSRDVGDGCVPVAVRAHDRQAQRQVRRKHARQRGGRQGRRTTSQRSVKKTTKIVDGYLKKIQKSLR